MKNILGILFTTAIIVLVTVAIIFGMVFESCSGLYDFFNNQTIAVLIGISTVFLAYYFWKKQHATELSGQYFEKLLEVTLDILYHDDVLIFEFEAEKNEESDKVFRKKMLLSSRQDTYMMLLEDLGDDRPEKLRKILKKYGDDYLEILAECRGNGFDSIKEKYSKLRKSVRFDVLKLTKTN